MMSKANITMRAWLKNAHPEHAKTLAYAAGTSVPHLRHVAAGRRQMSAELAQKLAKASRTADLPKELELDQKALCKACSHCPIAR